MSYMCFFRCNVVLPQLVFSRYSKEKQLQTKRGQLFLRVLLNLGMRQGEVPIASMKNLAMPQMVPENQQIARDNLIIFPEMYHENAGFVALIYQFSKIGHAIPCSRKIMGVFHSCFSLYICMPRKNSHDIIKHDINCTCVDTNNIICTFCSKSLPITQELAHIAIGTWTISTVPQETNSHALVPKDSR